MDCADIWLYARLTEVVKRGQWIKQLAKTTNATIGIIITDWPRPLHETNDDHILGAPFPYLQIKDLLSDYKSLNIFIYPSLIINVEDVRSSFCNEGCGSKLFFTSKSSWRVNLERQICLGAEKWQNRILSTIHEIQLWGFHGLFVTWRGDLTRGTCKSKKHSHAHNKTQQEHLSDLMLRITKTKNKDFHILLGSSTYPAPANNPPHIEIIHRTFDESIHDFILASKKGTSKVTATPSTLAYHTLSQSTRMLNAISHQFTHYNCIGPLPSSYLRMLDNFLLKPTGRLGKTTMLHNQCSFRRGTDRYQAVLRWLDISNSTSPEISYLEHILSIYSHLRTYLKEHLTSDDEIITNHISPLLSQNIFISLQTAGTIKILFYLNPSRNRQCFNPSVLATALDVPVCDEHAHQLTSKGGVVKKRTLSINNLRSKMVIAPRTAGALVFDSSSQQLDHT